MLFLIPGMTWAEINAIWKGGVSSYMRDGANILDFTILALFWSYMVLTLISYLQVRWKRWFLYTKNIKTNKQNHRCKKHRYIEHFIWGIQF